MAESFPMNSGDVTYSYTNNSQLQKQAYDSAKGMIKEAITEKIDIEILDTFRIVDFGCSVGPNTFFAMEDMIEAVKNKCILQGLDSTIMEFQVSFNDHTENDFNTLFASLPPDRQYHAAGVPGSFYGRLFPRCSINLAYSSYALQWLSNVPDRVSDRKSTAWNEGKIHYGRSSRDVVDAYVDRFEKDMGVFFSARAEEIVSGGLMVLIMPGIPETAAHLPHSVGVFFNLLGSSLMDLANEGIIDKAEIDEFNLPIYFPTGEEMRKVIEKNGCFSIELIELAIPEFRVNGPSLNPDRWIMHARAGLEGIFTKHFGYDVTEKMFNKTLAKREEILKLWDLDHFNSTHMYVVLKRK